MTDIIELTGRLHHALEAMPSEHRTIEAAEQAIRDHFADEPNTAERFIAQVHDEVEQGWQVDTARTALRSALTKITGGVNDVRAAMKLAEDAYDVEIVEGRGKGKIDAALIHIELLVDAIRANVPEAGK